MSMQLINMGVRWQKSEPEAFSMTVNTALAGSANDTFILPLYLIDSVKVAWGDGTFSTHTTGGSVTHIYPSSGIYNIKITGKADQVIRFNNVGDKAKLLSVDSFGDFKFLTADGTFYGCTALTTLDVSGWDVGSVTSFSRFTQGCTSLTTFDVSSWDVGSVTSFFAFANNCTSLTTLDVSNWDVSKVTNFGYFAYNCISLTTLDVSNWDTSKVVDFSHFARECTSLTTLDASNWDVSKVTNFGYFAYNCISLTTLDASNWDTSKVVSFRYFASGCTSLTTLDVSSWDVSKVTDFNAFAFGCSSLTTLDASSWDVSNVTIMGAMFRNATSFNQDLSQWCVRKVLSLPINFAAGSALPPANYPVWGTCPRNEDGLN